VKLGRGNLVRAFLKAKGAGELSVADSVRVWLGRDAVGWYGHASDPPTPKPPPAPRAPRGPNRRPRATPQIKQSLYFELELVEEIEREAARQERTFGRIVRDAWDLAKSQIRTFPGRPT